ncbi:MAG: type VI secretion system baseplate subunit TssG [Desulfuromonadaceae bacterium]
MGSEKRTESTPVKERLYNEFYRFSFYQAVSLLERLASGRKKVGEELSPGREPVRFSVIPGFSFPASDISSLDIAEGETQPVLEVAFLGLIGPSGVLPYWYNELAAERRSQKDTALTAFFDIFHHRLLSLFYLAWKKYHFQNSYRPDAKDRFSFYLKSLIGLGTVGLSENLGLPAEAPMHFGGLLSRRTPTVSAVSSSVSYYFEVDACIDQFVSRLITLCQEDRTAIGKANSRLGVDTVFGSQIWENQTMFRLNLGPMPFKVYTRFLPGGDKLVSVFSFVKYQVGIEYEFDVRVILKREDAPSCRLGGASADGTRLGWTTWLKSPSIPLKADPFATFQESDAVGNG